MQDYLRSLKEK